MYKYIGPGFLVGIPARDLSRDEFEALDKAMQAIVKTCGLYEYIKVKSPKETQEK